jgi:hypothetical protein
LPWDSQAQNQYAERCSNFFFGVEVLNVTAIEQESWWHRFIWQSRRCWKWLHGETLSPFFRHERDDSLPDLGYLLLEYVMNGGPLSSTFNDYRHDEMRRDNLYRGISRILLDLANVPLPRIGSWKMDGRGVISLTNRPLLDLPMLWARHNIPTGIPRVRCFSRPRMIVLTLIRLQNLTYTSGDTFVKDLLSYQDLRLRHQPNSILGRSDGVFQLSALTVLRALFPKFYNQSSRDDPLVLTLPDLHQSNILVDDDWSVVSVIDFEFAPVQPQQMVGVPHWLSGKSIDELIGPELDEYQVLYDSFVGILREEEAANQQATLSANE